MHRKQWRIVVYDTNAKALNINDIKKETTMFAKKYFKDL
jgi:hypothetical protein